MICSSSKAMATHADWQLCLTPGSFSHWRAQDADESFPGDLVELMEDRSMAGGVNTWEKKGDLGQSKADAQQNKLCLRILQ